MFRILIPCMIWLSTVRSDTGMHTSMPGDGPLMEKMPDDSALSKPKRGSIHQPCGPIYAHDVPAYAPPVYKPYVQQTYLKKELGVQPLAHLQYVQQPVYTPPMPSIAYVKPAIDYHQTAQPSIQYVKPAMPMIYHKPELSYAPIYQKPLYYASMYHQRAMYHHDAMPRILYGKYDAPVTQFVYQKPPLLHAPAPYAAPKVVQVQAPHVSYVKPVVHAPPPVHNSVIVKPHCA